MTSLGFLVLVFFVFTMLYIVGEIRCRSIYLEFLNNQHLDELDKTVLKLIEQEPKTYKELVALTKESKELITGTLIGLANLKMIYIDKNRFRINYY